MDMDEQILKELVEAWKRKDPQTIVDHHVKHLHKTYMKIKNKKILYLQTCIYVFTLPHSNILPSM